MRTRFQNIRYFQNLFHENRAVYEIMTTDENTIRRTCVACRVTKATKTHSEYVTLIAFQRQQWLREGATIFRCICIAFLAARTIHRKFTARIE